MFDTIIEQYEDMSFKDIDLGEAKRLLNQFENQLEYWENEKEIAFNETQPKATSIESEKVQGGLPSNKNDIYIIKLEKIQIKINVLRRRINNLNKYIDKEINIIKGYDPIQAKIIILRDKHHLQWDAIHEATGYSVRQAKRKYYEHLARRKDGTPMAQDE